ncbi:hypothetical protein Q7C36_006499 [Tachysurus vachellii]|uniref:Uncharacterized protein n=1 Tax=Tachysurus vachellii TaxID=175792 RepID=A0AA88T1I3_TACVA|nr:hypothetical protein Q7C36_006499 [Tachysurus vachellii]
MPVSPPESLSQPESVYLPETLSPPEPEPQLASDLPPVQTDNAASIDSSPTPSKLTWGEIMDALDAELQEAEKLKEQEVSKEKETLKLVEKKRGKVIKKKDIIGEVIEMEEKVEDMAKKKKIEQREEAVDVWKQKTAYSTPNTKGVELFIRGLDSNVDEYPLYKEFLKFGDISRAKFQHEETVLVPGTTPDTVHVPVNFDPVDNPGYYPVYDSVYDPVDDPVDDPMYDPVYDPVDDPMYDPMYDPVYDPVDDPVYDPVYDPVDDPVDDPMYDPVYDPVYYPMYYPEYYPVYNPVCYPVYKPVDCDVYYHVLPPNVSPQPPTVETVEEEKLEPLSPPETLSPPQHTDNAASIDSSPTPSKLTWGEIMDALDAELQEAEKLKEQEGVELFIRGLDSNVDEYPLYKEFLKFGDISRAKFQHEETVLVPGTTPDTVHVPVNFDPVDNPGYYPVYDSVYDPVDDPVDDPMYDPVYDPVDDPMYDPMYDPVYDPVDDPVYDPVYDPVDDPVDDPMYDPVYDPVYYPMYYPEYYPVYNPVCYPVYKPVDCDVYYHVLPPNVSPQPPTVETVEEEKLEPLSPPETLSPPQHTDNAASIDSSPTPSKLTWGEIMDALDAELQEAEKLKEQEVSKEKETLKLVEKKRGKVIKKKDIIGEVIEMEEKVEDMAKKKKIEQREEAVDVWKQKTAYSTPNTKGVELFIRGLDSNVDEYPLYKEFLKFGDISRAKKKESSGVAGGKRCLLIGVESD